MKGNGGMKLKVDLENLKLKMDRSIRDSFNADINMVMAAINGLEGIFMKVNFIKIDGKDSEPTTGLMAVIIKANGKIKE